MCLRSVGLLKTHNLSFQDSESLQAVFDKESCANMLHAQPRSAHSLSLCVPLLSSYLLCITFIFPSFFSSRLLVDTVLHFPPSLEEVSVSVSGERVWFRNHVDDEAGEEKPFSFSTLLKCWRCSVYLVFNNKSITLYSKMIVISLIPPLLSLS